MDKDLLLKSLTELDFMAVDIGLYLDTHPTDKDAIAEYNKVVKAADTVRMKYEKLVGPMCSFRSANKCEDVWLYATNPWPWCPDANYTITEEECC
ncbi:MAG: spore coat protein CotJB [Clostridia bacterium]|jgi:spore coat protein JB|nr:spore coat protein CotJB [Clostridia bacterium]